MPEIGTTIRMKVGIKSSAKFIWMACIDCGKERWVNLRYIKQSKSQRCHRCANRKKLESIETKTLMNSRRKAYFQNPINRLRMSLALANKPKSLEHRQHLSESRKQFLANHPDFNQAHFKGHNHTRETKAICRLATLGRKQDVEEKLKRVAAFKKYYLEHPEERRFGEKAPCWQGGISFIPYPSIFNNLLKEEIRKRDNYTCQLCKVPQLECTEKLSIHHINHNKSNCLSNNLISLCRRCNAKVEHNRQYWKTYLIQTLITRGIYANSSL